MPTVKEEMAEIKKDIEHLGEITKDGFKSTNRKIDAFEKRFDDLPEAFVPRREHEAAQKATRNFISVLVPVIGIVVTIAVALITKG